MTTKQNQDNDFQYAQRLPLGQNIKKVPKVLENFHDYKADLLQKREEWIRLNKTGGNNLLLKEYKALLPKELSPFVFSWCIGFILSDATIQKSYSLKNVTFRLKIQQVGYNLELLEVTLELLKPYVFGISPVKGRKEMFTIDTIRHEAFNIFHDIFQNPMSEWGREGCVEKIIPSNIEEYLDPIAISSWYCGDGGKSDYTSNQGKGIEFATHGFSFECNQRLANALRKRYGWDVKVVYDYTSKKNNIDRYYLKVASGSFHSVEKILKPYLLDSFLRKFPTSRSLRSKYRDVP